jgi:hypothetical protein
MTFSSFNIVYDAGVIGPAWSLEDALEIAGELFSDVWFSGKPDNPRRGHHSRY